MDLDGRHLEAMDLRLLLRPLRGGVNDGLEYDADGDGDVAFHFRSLGC